MKFSLPIIVTFVALIAAHAQTDEAAAPMPTLTADYCTLVHVSATSGDDLLSAELLFSYVANVDGLLRDLADRMRFISEQVEAGELTPVQAQAMQLETSKEMIGRLQRISAVYEVIIFSGEDLEAPTGGSSEASRGLGLQTNLTVSVDELLREAAQ